MSIERQYNGYTIYPHGKGWRIPWVFHVSPSVTDIKLGIAQATSEHRADYFSTLREARVFIDRGMQQKADAMLECAT